MNLSHDHVALLSALNEHKVKYLVIGGYAVGFHSEPRTTKDLDIFIRGDEENSQAVYRALASFGAPLAGVSPVDFRDGKSMFQMGFPPERVDVLQTIDGVEFDEGWETRINALVDGRILVPVISVDKLIANKLATGRPRDFLDVQDIRDAQSHVPTLPEHEAFIILQGWQAGFRKVAFTRLLQKRLGYTLSEAKLATDRILTGAPLNVMISPNDFDQFAFDAKGLGLKSVTRRMLSNDS